MILIADENVEKAIVERLRFDGLSVEYVAESAAWTEDQALLDRANSHDALLLTSDKDFGELVYRRRQAASGVVLLRLSGTTRAEKVELVAALFRLRCNDPLNAFTVVSTTKVRIRRRPEDHSA